MVVSEIGGGFFCGSCNRFLLVVVNMGFILGCRCGFLLVILVVVAFLWLLLLLLFFFFFFGETFVVVVGSGFGGFF